MPFSIIIPRQDQRYKKRKVLAFGKKGAVNPDTHTAELKSETGGPTYSNPKRKKTSNHWAWLFRGVKPGTYTLTIKDGATVIGGPVTGITVDTGHAVDIDFPDEDVTSPFISYGTTDAITQPSAALTAPSYSVQFLFGPPENETYWAFEFSDVNPGDYTLTVTTGGSSDQELVHVVP